VNVWEEYDYDPSDLDSGERRPVKCRRCGSTDVRWRQQGGKWVLFSSTPGVEHNCVTDSDFTPAP